MFGWKPIHWFKEHEWKLKAKDFYFESHRRFKYYNILYNTLFTEPTGTINKLLTAVRKYKVQDQSNLVLRNKTNKPEHN